jgi:hypothetical protein
VQDIKQAVSLSEVVVKYERRPVTNGIDTHDAAGRHFQLFLTVADKDNSLAKRNAVACYGHRPARERSNRRKRISSALSGSVRANANEKRGTYQQERANVSSHRNPLQ